MHLTDTEILAALREVGITGPAAVTLLENAGRNRAVKVPLKEGDRLPPEILEARPPKATHYPASLLRGVPNIRALHQHGYLVGASAYRETPQGLLRVDWFRDADGAHGASWYIWDRRFGWSEEPGWEEYRQYPGAVPENLVALPKVL